MQVSKINPAVAEFHFAAITAKAPLEALGWVFEDEAREDVRLFVRSDSGATVFYAEVDGVNEAGYSLADLGDQAAAIDAIITLLNSGKIKVLYDHSIDQGWNDVPAFI